MNNAAKTEATETVLRLGQPTNIPDGTYYVLAVWNAKARDYKDVPGAYADADAVEKMRKVGMRTVKYTVHQGFVTTRRGLR